MTAARTSGVAALPVVLGIVLIKDDESGATVVCWSEQNSDMNVSYAEPIQWNHYCMVCRDARRK